VENGFQTSDMGFALITGLGDFTGVTIGHALYYTLKKLVYKRSIDLKTEYNIGFFLGSAAFCSGFIWQPSVNLLQALSLPFVGVAFGTWATCGIAFLAGLRVFRILYSPIISIEPPTKANFVGDAQLSVSIGGATGAFVGTDVVYLNGEGNFLRPLVGVEATDSALIGCFKAGSATSIGLFSAQTVQNIAQPASSKNWTD
jgi:hypothetical protein